MRMRIGLAALVTAMAAATMLATPASAAPRSLKPAVGARERQPMCVAHSSLPRPRAGTLLMLGLLAAARRRRR